jgi:hypothetical protein
MFSGSAISNKREIELDQEINNTDVYVVNKGSDNYGMLSGRYASIANKE